MKVLFVCLGNICRSPIAEGIMHKLIKEYNLPWEVDSASTNTYHTGEAPHISSQKVCRENGIDISTQRARRIQKSDFEHFDHILVMANDVKSDIQKIVKSAYDENKVSLLMDEIYPGEYRDVPDPWYGTEKDFYEVYDLIKACCEAFVSRYATQK